MSIGRRSWAVVVTALLALALGAAPAYADPPAPPVPKPAATEPPPPPGTEPLHVEHPTPEILAARAALAHLQDEAARQAEAYNHAREVAALDRQQAALAKEAARLADLRVKRARAQLSELAAAAYRDGSASIPALLLTSDDPTEVMQKVQTLHVVGDRQTDIFTELREAEAAAKAAHRAADEAVTAADAAARDVQAKEKLAREQATQVAARLAVLENREGMAERLASEGPASAEARDRLPQILADLATGSKALTEAAAAALAAGNPISPADGGALPPSPRTGKTIADALDQLGKVYVWGAAGPTTFDCSGLTQWVWAKAGVKLPHNAQMQFDALPRVPLDRMLPGDLVFFWDPDGKGGRYIGHVGIYLGKSQMVDAPHTGDFVRIDPIWATVAGAARVG
jgi:cell wall-associated NlpC family hydrolase